MAVRFALPVLHSPLFFLGRLKPFFSFWKRKKRMGSKTLPVCAERRQPPLGKGAFEWTKSSAPAGVKVNFKSCKRADEYPRGAGRICNAPSSRTAALGIGPYKHNRAHGGKTIKRMPCSSLCPLCKKRDTAKGTPAEGHQPNTVHEQSARPPDNFRWPRFALYRLMPLICPDRRDTGRSRSALWCNPRWG